MKAKHKNQVWLEIGRYMDQLRQDGTNDDLDLSEKNMQKYIGGPITIKTMLHMLQDELEKGSKTIYPEVMEEIFCYQKHIIK